MPYPAPLPEDAPLDFAQAFRSARKAGKPMLIDFWAEWCAPCIKLKKETLADPEVKKALKGVEIIFVDLDKHPRLAKGYGVVSVPDVFFVDGSGQVVDRSLEFEEPAEFLKRIPMWLGQQQVASLGVETSIPSKEVVEDLMLTNNVRIQGRLIKRIKAGSPADMAGLLPGDVLLRLAQNDLYSADDIKDFLAVSSPGDRVPVRYKRPGESEELEATIVLGSQDSSAVKDGLVWQYSGPGQLPAALDEARAKKKKVLVGLSGAET